MVTLNLFSLSTFLQARTGTAALQLHQRCTVHGPTCPPYPLQAFRHCGARTAAAAAAAAAVAAAAKVSFDKLWRRNNREKILQRFQFWKRFTK